MAKAQKSKEILLSVESKNSGGKGMVYEFTEEYTEEMNFDFVTRIAEMSKGVPGQRKIFVKITGDGKVVLCEPQSAHMEIVLPVVK